MEKQSFVVQLENCTKMYNLLVEINERIHKMEITQLEDIQSEIEEVL